MPYKHTDASVLDRKLKIQNKSPSVFPLSVVKKRKALRERSSEGAHEHVIFFFVLFHGHDIMRGSDPNAGVNFFFTCTYFKMRDSFKGPKHFFMMARSYTSWQSTLL